jgi:hypothetical protein
MPGGRNIALPVSGLGAAGLLSFAAMKIRIVPHDASRTAAWDAFVESNPHAWVGHSSAVLRLEAALGNRSFSLMALDGSDRVVAVAPLFLVQYTLSRMFQVRSLVSGTQLRGGPLLDAGMNPKNRRALFAAFTAELEGIAGREQIDQVRIAFPHVFGDRLNTDIYPVFPLRDHGFSALANYTLLLPLGGGPERLFKGITPPARRQIKRAKAAGAECVAITDRQQWLDCDELNRDTFTAEEADAFSLEFLQLAWDELVATGLGQVFGVRHQGQLVNAVLTVGTRHSQYIWLLFSRQPRPLAGANDMLFWYVIETLAEQGCNYLEVGSMDFDDPRMKAISDFKRKFGAQPRPSLEGLLVYSDLKLTGAHLVGALSRKVRDSAAYRKVRDTAVHKVNSDRS